MSDWKPSHELIALLTQVAEGDISPADHARFEKLLSDDAAARNYALDYLSLHAQLTWNVDDVLPEQLGSAAVIALENEPAPVSPASDSPKGLLKMSYWRGHRLQFGAVALVLTLVFWVGFFVVVFTRDGDKQMNPDPFGLPAGVLAQLTDVRGAVWEEGAKSYADADLLLQDESLELAGGFVEITFRDGAVVLLQGPAHFTVDTRGAGTLEHGRLVARIEKQAGRSEVIPFAISTPLAQVIDLGTEFGVEAESDGTTQVDVFQGRVEATPQGEAKTARSRPLLLVQGQSARIAPGDDQFDRQGGGEYVRELPAGDIITVQRNAANWRSIESGRIAAGEERLYVYAAHCPRQVGCFLSFDVSAYYGMQALGPARLILTVESGAGIQDDRNFELELRQLNGHNARVDLDAASSWYLDGDEEEGSNLWRDNSGAELPDLGRDDESQIPAITSLLTSRTGPFGGDTATTDPAPGSQITLTIPRAALQRWLDQTEPSILVLSLDPGSQPFHHPNGVFPPTMGPYFFGRGESYPLPMLDFQVIDPTKASETSGPPAAGADNQVHSLRGTAPACI